MFSTLTSQQSYTGDYWHFKIIFVNIGCTSSTMKRPIIDTRLIFDITLFYCNIYLKYRLEIEIFCILDFVVKKNNNTRYSYVIDVIAWDVLYILCVIQKKNNFNALLVFSTFYALSVCPWKYGNHKIFWQ